MFYAGRPVTTALLGLVMLLTANLEGIGLEILYNVCTKQRTSYLYIGIFRSVAELIS
jgi:hypothetical protein